MAAYPHKIDPATVVEDAKARWTQWQVRQWPGGEIRVLKELSPEVTCALEALVDAINEANHHD